MAGYVKMNSSLRLASEKVPEWMTAHLKGNRYVNTIYLCASAMNKISRASRIPRGRKVFRGMAGVKLPDIFVVPGEDGGRGGDEFAFMSCSTRWPSATSTLPRACRFCLSSRWARSTAARRSRSCRNTQAR